MAFDPSARDEIREAINKFLSHFKLSADEVFKLVPKIMQSLEKNKDISFSSKGLQNNKAVQDEFQKTCLTEMQKNIPRFNQPDLKFLLKTPQEMQMDELKNILKDYLKKLFKLTPEGKKKRNKEEDEKLDKAMEFLAKSLADKISKQDPKKPLYTNKTATNVVDALTAAIEQSYGVDIRQTGSLAKPQQSAPAAVTMQNFATSEGNSFLAGLKKETGDDPLCEKFMNTFGNIAMIGGLGDTHSMSETKSMHITPESPSPFSTKPKPPWENH
jgi:hypothetical protein